ncbi:MAG: alpha-E domain-containing protein [Bacteroidia bacterium]|nr:alpha-E domain-containing protein [Bacteroidia bacterium]
MLARVADSLFWIGRYIERSEHLARFTKIQYFSALDAPLYHKQGFVLNSIGTMAGLSADERALGEEELLFRVGLDRNAPVSIYSAVSLARTNARGARDLLSSELWEAINKYYHFVQNYPVEVFKTRGLYDFTQQVLVHCIVIKGTAENTLLHDQVWAFIQCGIYLERALQTARIIQTKLLDISSLADEVADAPTLEQYQISTLLAATEGFDMSRRFYKTEVDRRMALEFLILNPVFPRSISYSLRKLLTYLQRISPAAPSDPQSVEFVAGKLSASLQYLTIGEILPDPMAFLQEILGRLYRTGELMHANYLKY